MIYRLLGSLEITSPGADHVKSLRHAIGGLSSARGMLAYLHEAAHDASEFNEVGRNATGLAALTELSLLMATDDAPWPVAHTRLSKPLWSSYASTAFSLSSGAIDALIHTITAPYPDMCPGHRVAELRIRWPLSTFRKALLSSECGTALLRFINGILAALCLQLAIVLSAISRQPASQTFVLVMLAACLRYGYRDDPDDHAFLPIRRNLTFLGSCPTF